MLGNMFFRCSFQPEIVSMIKRQLSDFKRVTSCLLNISLQSRASERSHLWMKTDFLFAVVFFFFFPLKALNNMAKDKKGGFCSRCARFPRRKKVLKSFSTTCPDKSKRGFDFTWESLSNKYSACQSFPSSSRPTETHPDKLESLHWPKAKSNKTN